LLGILVWNDGDRDSNTSLIIANHISVLDHAAIDLIEPCILPSVWDIPNLLRWLFGYTDLGARQGRNELVRQARQFCQDSTVPLLAFPEGAMTGGRKAMLRFSTWPFDVSDRVQPVVLTIERPLFACIAPSVLGGTWWQDVLYFLFIPLSIIRVRWLPTLRRRVDESVETFTERAANTMASALGIRTSSFTGQDVVEAAKRHLVDRSVAQSSANLAPGQLDAATMRLKQTYPSCSLHAIRLDLERTKNVLQTSNHIREGRLKNKPDKKTPDTSWKARYNDRKWSMIEDNRQKYLQRTQL